MPSDVGPDRGYAWVIAFSACIINMILSGLSRMIGILYVAVLKEYGVSRQEATQPFSVRNSIRCLSGPLAGLVGQHIGIRKITFMGGILASLGACLCAIAPDIVWLTVFWGGIHGFGFAFANTLFQVVVNQYFDKYRVTASGIALSGACVGSLGFPFMIEAILDSYSLSGGFLILGGVVMHVLPPALLLCPPPWLNKKKPKAVPKSKEKTTQRDQPNSPPITTEEDLPEETTRCEIYRTTSLSNCPLDGIELRKEKRPGSPISGGSQTPIGSRSYPRNNKLCSRVQEEQFEETSQEEQELNSPKIIIQNGHHSTDASCPDKKDAVSNSVKKRNIVVSGLLSILKLYMNPVYMLISVGMAIYVVVFIPILTVIVDYSKDKGIRESEGKYLINAMALGDLIGRLGFGWVTDRGYMTISKFFTTTLILQGVFVSLFPLAGDLGSLMAVVGMYGMTAGMMLILFPVLVLKYVSVEEQAVAMGNVGFLSGMVTFGLPPLIGHFRDGVGSYDGMFYLIGGASFASGALWFLEPVLARRLEAQKQRQQQQQATEHGVGNAAFQLSEDELTTNKSPA